MTEIIIPLAVFAMIVAVVYILAHRKERLALIEKGLDASMLKIEKRPNASLKWGLFLIGIAIGILLGNIISETTFMREEVAYFSMIFICGGLSLLIYYFINKKQLKDHERKEM